MSTNSRKILIQSQGLDSLSFGFLFWILAYYILKPGQPQLLNLTFVSLMTLICLGFGIGLTLILYKSRIVSLGQAVFFPQRIEEDTRAWFKTFWGLQLIFTFLVTFFVGIIVTEFSFYELFSEEGFAGARRIFSSLVQPNFQILPRALLAIVETIFIAFIATALALPISFLLSFLCAKNLMSKSSLGLTIYGALRTMLNVTRSIEPLIWAIVFSVWVGIGPFAGMLALMLHSIASLAKQYSEIIECIDEGPIEGIEATGGNTLQVIWFAVVPQIVLPYVAFTIYRWDINVRMATVIGLVGGGGIGTMLIQYQGQALWNEVGCLVLLIAAAVWIMDMTSGVIREAIK